MEIITGIENRRRWRLEETLRIVAEAPSACFVAIARRHYVSHGLLWHWLRQVRSGELRRLAPTSFLPLQVIPNAALAMPTSVAVPASTPRSVQRAADKAIEIMLPDGTTVRVGRNAGAVALRRGLNGLAMQMQQVLGRDPRAGDLYVFRCKRGDRGKFCISSTRSRGGGSPHPVIGVANSWGADPSRPALRLGPPRSRGRRVGSARMPSASPARRARSRRG